MTNWRGVVGYEDYYRISDDGQIWSIRSNRLLKTPPNKYRGYMEFEIKVNGYRRTAQIHQEVLKAFVGPQPTGMQVRHLNGDKLDNRLQNLKYGTPKENSQDRFLHGTDNKGSKHPKTDLTEEYVGQIKVAANAGRTPKELLEQFNISYSVLTAIINENSWTHVEPKIDRIKRGDHIEEWLYLVNKGIAVNKIADYYQVNHTAIVSALKRTGQSIRSIRKTISLNKSLSVEQALALRTL